jgi:hypothetical protein
MVGHVTGLDQVRDGGIGFRQSRGGAGAREARPCAQVCVAIAVTMARAQRTISLRGAKRAAREVYVGRTQKSRAVDVMASTACDAVLPRRKDERGERIGRCSDTRV